MGVLITIGTVSFAVLCVLLVIIILLQSDKSAGMGILGGSSQSAFGSSTADVITKATAVMVAIFMTGSLGLAILESYRDKAIEKDLLDEGAETPGIIEMKASTPAAPAETPEKK
ncbi:MAG TPA: preprotein translocase subunit SecG [Spirochaetota bacterium]|nr:preprotein translocase subunit SecG [Spirochaetota bacterium]